MRDSYKLGAFLCFMRSLTRLQLSYLGSILEDVAKPVVCIEIHLFSLYCTMRLWSNKLLYLMGGQFVEMYEF